MRSPTDPCVGVGSRHQSVDLGGREEADQFPVDPFVGDGEDPMDQAGVIGVSERRVSEQGVHGSESVVAGADAVVTVVFEVLEERSDQRRVEILYQQLGGGLPVRAWAKPSKSRNVSR